MEEAPYAVLNQRVSSLEAQFQQWTSSLTAQISGLSSKLEERGRTQWPLVAALAGVVLTGMAYLDSAKLSPLKERDAEITTVLKELQREMKDSMVPQWVHGREWKYRDDQFIAHASRVEIIEKNTSDRIKRLEEMFGSTWNIRDAIQVFQQRIDRLEQAIPKN